MATAAPEPAGLGVEVEVEPAMKLAAGEGRSMREALQSAAGALAGAGRGAAVAASAAGIAAAVRSGAAGTMAEATRATLAMNMHGFARQAMAEGGAQFASLLAALVQSWPPSWLTNRAIQPEQSTSEIATNAWPAPRPAALAYAYAGRSWSGSSPMARPGQPGGCAWQR